MGHANHLTQKLSEKRATGAFAALAVALSLLNSGTVRADYDSFDRVKPNSGTAWDEFAELNRRRAPFSSAAAAAVAQAPSQARQPASVAPAEPAPERVRSNVVSIAGAGPAAFQIQYIINGRTFLSNVQLPQELGTQIQPEFKPTRSEITMLQGRIATVTLMENLPGQPEHRVRKIMIELSNGGASGCRAVIYPSGGNFYSLPVLVNQSCSSILRDPALASGY